MFVNVMGNVPTLHTMTDDDIKSLSSSRQTFVKHFFIEWKEYQEILRKSTGNRPRNKIIKIMKLLSNEYNKVDKQNAYGICVKNTHDQCWVERNRINRIHSMSLVRFRMY